MGDQAHRPAGPRLILVKHAMPVVEPGQPPSTWALSREGRIAARELAQRLAAFEPTALVASTEPKALATAEAMAGVLGLPVEANDDLREHRADTAGFFADPAAFEARVERLFAEPQTLVFGEETAAEAHARFAAAVERSVAKYRGGVLVLVAHGRVMALWAQRRFGVEPMPLWRHLGLPSALVVSEEGAEYHVV